MSQAAIRTKAHVRYPNTYVWLVFLSALDAMLTYLVLHFGGIEANAMAARVMETWGFAGMVTYKFALISLTIVICEVVGRRDARAGQFLGLVGIGLTCVPVAIALVLLAAKAG
ncbi:MAG: DUF5658 family protein [Tepidisphaeraceae bacterium]